MNSLAILAPLDGSRVAERALPLALRLCLLQHTELALLRVIPIPLGVDAQLATRLSPSRDLISQLESDAQDYLHTQAQTLQSLGVITRISTRVGPPALEILKYCASHAVGMIVLSTHGLSGVSRAVRGSVADRVILESPCPVLVVPARYADSLHRAIQAHGAGHS